MLSLLAARSMVMVAPVLLGVVHSVSDRVMASPTMRPLGMIWSWARRGTLTVVHSPGFRGVGFESDLLWAASIQPRLTMP